MFQDNRPEAIAQRKLQAMVADSPLIATQRSAQERIRGSRYVAAQRQRMAAQFGGSARVETGEEGQQQTKAESSPALQGARQPIQREIKIQLGFGGKQVLTERTAVNWLKRDDRQLYPVELEHLGEFLNSVTKTYGFLQHGDFESDLETFVAEKTGKVTGQVEVEEEPEPKKRGAFRIVKTYSDYQEVEFGRSRDQPENGYYNDDGYYYRNVGSSVQAILYERRKISAVAFFRGLHFKMTWSRQKHREEINKLIVGEETFSSASYELAIQTAQSPNPTTEQLLAATKVVNEHLQSMRGYVDKHKESKRKKYEYVPRQQGEDETYTRGGGKSRNIEYLDKFSAALSLYVNSQVNFEKDLAKLERGEFGGGGYIKIPFLSTSKKATEAAKYAKGKVQKDEDVRTGGIVGRIYIYVGPAERLKEEGAIDIVSAHDKSVYVCEWRFGEQEITFSGSIPGEFLQGQMLVKGKDSVEAIGDHADQIAESQAEKYGGLSDYTS